MQLEQGLLHPKRPSVNDEGMLEDQKLRVKRALGRVIPYHSANTNEAFPNQAQVQSVLF